MSQIARFEHLHELARALKSEGIFTLLATEHNSSPD